MKNLELINPENISETEVVTYPIREAARAIVIDAANNIGILHVVKDNYYKIPGGGIEQGEDKETALRRECLEEIGCEIEVLGEIGSIVEYRKFCSMKQISFCYLATVKGEKGSPHFTDEEIQNAFTLLWVPYEKALELFSKNESNKIEANAYMVPRDLLFLQTAKKSKYLMGELSRQA